jgi:predicted MPP superfamily phosphohydrolase
MKKEINNKIMIVGDIHWKPELNYAELIKDRRIAEKKEILDFIVESSQDCNTIIFMGDQLNLRNNTSEVIKEFVNFLERFEDKKLYIISGNHEKDGTGKTAIDFLKEIKNKKNWTIITNKVIKEKNLVFCPYFSKAELEVDTNEEASKKIMKMLKENKGDILFIHHALTNTTTSSGIITSIFPEPVLPRKKLEEIYKFVIGSHIHHPQVFKNSIVTGSIFCNETGEHKKFIWEINQKTLKVTQIKLPGRGIFKSEDPTDADLNKIPKNSIIKAIITKEISTIKINELKEKLSKFDAYVLLSQIPKKRKKLHFKEGGNLLEFSVSQLLKVYAEEKEISLERLMRGFELIKK